MKKIIYILLFLIAYSVSYSYQKMTNSQIKSIQNSSTRLVNDLSGNWDIETNGDSYKRFVPFSDLYNDEIVLRKVVSLPKDAKESYSWHLNFSGVSNQVEIYWNEQFIGRYFDAIIPFEVKIPDKFITQNNNTLKLILKKSEGLREKFLTNHLFAKKNYVGPIREIFLIGKPHIWVSDFKATTEFSNNFTNAYLDINLSISSANIQKLIDRINKTDSLKVGFTKKFNFDYQIQIIDKISGTIIANSDLNNAEIESERSLDLKNTLFINNPKLWDNATPNLYEIKIKITKNSKSIDEISYNYGFRDIKISRNGNKSEIILNGNPFVLKGISYVEDYLETGQSISANKLKEDIENIKTLGINTIRFKYSTPSPYFVYLCDLYGILVFVDLPIYDQPSSLIKNNEIQVLIKNQLNQYISAYYPSPSFMAIGIGDGFNDSDILSHEFKTLLNKIKSSYDLFTYQIITLNNKSVIYKETDIVGIRAFTFEEGLDKFSVNLNDRIKTINNNPIFLDFGVIIQPDNHNGYSDHLSIEYQSYIIQNLYKIASTNQISGTNYNSYNDYLRESPLLIANNKDMYVNTSGLMSRDRKERISYSSMQAMNNNEKEPLLNTGSFEPYIPYTFIIYSIVLIIILFIILNQFKRFREYMFRSLLRPYNFYSDIRDQRIISISLTVILGLIVSINLGIYLSSIFYFFKNSLGFQYIMMIILNTKLLQEVLVKLVWMPDLSVFFISMITFAFAFVVAIVIKIFSMFNTKTVTYNDALMLSVWGALPWLILLPFSVVLFRVLLAYPISLVFFLFLLIVVLIWTLSRLAKSISVVFDLHAQFVGLITASVIFIIIFMLILYYQIQYSIFPYFNYLLKII